MTSQDGRQDHHDHQGMFCGYDDDRDSTPTGDDHALVSSLSLFDDHVDRVHSDRVLVLDRGRVLEYGSPRTLMEDGGSAFRALFMVQGKEEFEKLLEMTRGDEMGE